MSEAYNALALPFYNRMQLQTAFRTVGYLYRTEGFLPLWRGHGAVLVRIVPFAAIQFMSHEQFTHLLTVDGKTSPAAKFIAGALAGATGMLGGCEKRFLCPAEVLLIIALWCTLGYVVVDADGKVNRDDCSVGVSDDMCSVA